MGQRETLAHRTRSWVKRAVEGIAAPWIARVEIEGKKKKKDTRTIEFEDNVATVSPATAPESLLVFCNITNKIHKRTDTAVAFTQEYSRVSYKLRNVSTLSIGSGSSKDTRAGVEKTEERTFYI